MINSGCVIAQECRMVDKHHLTVDAYSGFKGEETPRSFTLDGATLHVAEVIDRWYTETHSYFRVHATDGRRYVLRYHLDEGLWELVMQERSREK
jgi:hypothetical protein